MSGSLVVLMGALTLTSLHRNNYTFDSGYHNFPKFWTNSGLCPAGQLTHEDIKESLLSDAMQKNLLYISALPMGAISHLRIHWLLELIQFEQFTQSGVPIYDFSVLDKFLMDLDDINLSPVIEFMGNFSDLFVKNPTQNDFLWEDLSYQITKHYLNMFGAKKVLNWRFETWNEPDLLTYNKLNFTVEGSRVFTENQSYKYYRVDVRLKPEIEKKSSYEVASVNPRYREFNYLLFACSEADPISGWSTPRDFQEDVSYATTLVNIILEHWSAKLNSKQFLNLETISHDNAFLSYHPYEFSQRTLLAHFRMNETNPPHSQYIQKPVYSALGLLSRLAEMASDVDTIQIENGKRLKVLRTTSPKKSPLFLSWLIMPPDDYNAETYTIHGNITLPPFHMCQNEIFAFIVEIIAQNLTNPVNVWNNFNRPSYPNSTIREAMRRQQTPKILVNGVLHNTTIDVDLSTLKAPWMALLRVCSILKTHLKTPQNLLLTPIKRNEVLVTWQDFDAESVQCLKTYEVWFRENDLQEWTQISFGWHLPFPSFQYAPLDGTNVNGFYKVRGINIFNNTSLFSAQAQYIEI